MTAVSQNLKIENFQKTKEISSRSKFAFSVGFFVRAEEIYKKIQQDANAKLNN